jgi:hypothetical protein
MPTEMLNFAIASAAQLPGRPIMRQLAYSAASVLSMVNDCSRNPPRPRANFKAQSLSDDCGNLIRLRLPTNHAHPVDEIDHDGEGQKVNQATDAH